MTTTVESRENGLEIVRVEGEVDLATADDLRKVLIERLDSGAKHLLVDLANLQFVDSTGLAAFLSTSLKARASSIRFSLVTPRARVRATFEIAGLRLGETLFESEEAALQAAGA